MRVKNVHGSSKVSDHPPKDYSSWLHYWMMNSQLSLLWTETYRCPACGRTVPFENVDGCHVQKADDLCDKHWYIVPLCDSCNQRKDIFDIGSIPVVPSPCNLDR